MEKLTFKISSGLKNIIGRELITDKVIAIFELVKNSYDAGANKVEISFNNIYANNASITIWLVTDITNLNLAFRN